jgi:uncharacterized membrane protein YphA (DoxX/SURF4 family)
VKGIFYKRENLNHRLLSFKKYSGKMKLGQNKAGIWNVLLLCIRIWLGYRMITASYSSVIDIIFHPEERAFFEKWFGDELHFPLPLLMAFLAKGAELSGGIFLLMGLLPESQLL